MLTIKISRNGFAAWCRRRNDKHIGIILDGHLIRTERLRGELGDMIEIAGYSTRKAAEKERDILQQGGNR